MEYQNRCKYYVQSELSNIDFEDIRGVFHQREEQYEEFFADGNNV